MTDETDELERRLLESPTARARFLADTLELLERNGVDTSTPQFIAQMGGALNLSQGTTFLGGLAASTVVIAIASAGQRGVSSGIGQVATLLPIASALGGASKAGQAASTVVIAIASAGQRGVDAKVGLAASTVVIAIASAGQRDFGSIGRAASTVVIAIASAGQRGFDAKVGLAASTVVIAIASAGQRGFGSIGQAASTVVIAIASAGQRGLTGRIAGGFELAPGQIAITMPAAATIAEVAQALQQLVDVLLGESVALEGELTQARDALADQSR